MEQPDIAVPAEMPVSRSAQARALAGKPRQVDGWTAVRGAGAQPRAHLSAKATYVLGDALQFLDELPARSIHAVVTDPPYGVIEYSDKNHEKLRSGCGGVWRIPPALDGVKRKPLPRFTVLTQEDVDELYAFFSEIASSLRRVLAPGGHIFIASNPLLSSLTFHAFQKAGFEKRGEVIRLVQTLRGGDRPKGAEEEFSGVSMMARSCWEPWGIFRKPMEGTAAENLRRWGTGGLRRVSDSEPFKDVIQCPPARGHEKEIAPHPSLKPQKFVRQLVRAALPLGTGIVCDPFAGSGSTLAAAEANGYLSIGIDRDMDYYELARRAFFQLATLQVDENDAE